MKLITEIREIDSSFNVQYITEEKTGKKRCVIQGPFAVAEQINRNGRLYSDDILSEAVRKYDNEFIRQNRGYGEFGHPSGPAINGDRICIRVLEMTKSKNVWEGRAQVSSTPMGAIVEGIISDGGKLGVSTRGMGSLREQNGVKYVNPDYYMAAVDVVTDPSGPNCYVNGIMENVEWIYDSKYGWLSQEIAEDHKKIIRKEYKKIDERRALMMFEHFINSIRGS